MRVGDQTAELAELLGQADVADRTTGLAGLLNGRDGRTAGRNDIINDHARELRIKKARRQR